MLEPKIDLRYTISQSKHNHLPKSLGPSCLSSAIRRIIWWVFTSNRGGPNRARLIVALKDRPMNANQLAEELQIDYKTVRHHLKVLLKNHMIVEQGEGYGTMYFVSPELEEYYEEFMGIWDKIGRK